MGTLGRTWDLARESFAVLLTDRDILVFPLISALALIAVDGVLLIPLGRQLRGPLTRHDLDAVLSPQYLYPMLFLLYTASYSVIIFFNSALMACANIRLSGGDPSLGDGLRVAWENIERILAWALVAATVGVLLRMLEQSRLVRLVAGRALELAWSWATYFIIPVILFEDLDVVDSLKRSAGLFRSRWGEGVTGNFSFGLLAGLLAFPAVTLGYACAGQFGSCIGLAVAGLYLAILSIVSAALQGIFVVALYRFATGQHSGFDSDLMQSVFS